jgi:hypothetical protein
VQKALRPSDREEKSRAGPVLQAGRRPPLIFLTQLRLPIVYARHQLVVDTRRLTRRFVQIRAAGMSVR